jgi:hypothetical protein
MGGMRLTLAETENYEWGLRVNWSNEYHSYSFVLIRKSDEQEIDVRINGYDTGDEACDKAFKELEDERKKRYNYQKMTEEQKTLSEIYWRMCDAETGNNVLLHRLEEAEKVIREFRAYELSKEKRAIE